ncbi:MAG: hypothetical protein GY796_34440 [Chloroflexi bacterium]|nr:hypothetical protein [Chloroflexota bacterium]
MAQKYLETYHAPAAVLLASVPTREIIGLTGDQSAKADFADVAADLSAVRFLGGG